MRDSSCCVSIYVDEKELTLGSWPQREPNAHLQTPRMMSKAVNHMAEITLGGSGISFFSSSASFVRADLYRPMNRYPGS